MTSKIITSRVIYDTEGKNGEWITAQLASPWDARIKGYPTGRAKNRHAALKDLTVRVLDESGILVQEATPTTPTE